ncbi:MAG: prolyl oligopeptidase family serine peptidase [bacterium]
MKKILLLIILCVLFAPTVKSENITLPIDRLLYSGSVQYITPILLDSFDINKNKYSDDELLKQNFFDYNKVSPKEGDTLLFSRNKCIWKKVSLDKKGWFIIDTKIPNSSYNYFVTYVEVKEFTELTLELETFNDIYVDIQDKKNEFIKSKKDASESKKIIVKLEPDVYKITFKVLAKNSAPIKFKAGITFNKTLQDMLLLKDNPKRPLHIKDLFSGESINSVNLSPTGDYAFMTMTRQLGEGKSESWTEYWNMLSDYCIPFNPSKDASNYSWGKDDFEVYYTTAKDSETSIWQYDFRTGKKKLITDGIKEFAYYRISPTNDFLIYGVNDELKDDKSVLKKVEGMEDRQKEFRKRTQLYFLDFNSLNSERLTYGKQSVQLFDISSDGKQLLCGISEPNYTKEPFSKNSVFTIDLSTRQINYLWKDNPYSIDCQFSPDNSQLLCTGGPEAFGKIGVNVKDSLLPNNYDTQAYIYHLKGQTVQAITKNFNPTIAAAYWCQYDNLIYFLVQEGTYKKLYKYNPILKKYENIPVNEDIVISLSLSKKSAGAVVLAQSSQNNTRAYKLNIQTKTCSLFSAPSDKYLKDITFGKIEEFDILNSKGDTIQGRIHYPTDFDSTKKYPVIVYYYGGTSPVGRNFDGRYPFDIYTAHGYVVYCLQPSGTIGYGQNFSAQHVNNWGKTTADEIIKGTKEMLAAHPFCIPEKVGCMGASYGGFMTMYLTTRTDIFACAISHAGISSIASYWGEGYWGYLYSAEATKNSYPWNNPKLYTEQSPLFNADKVKTPILLLHGDRDTNVPTGESIQFYTALKILGKDAELVLIEDTDHFVQKYEQRVKWNNSILSYFDKYLKGRPDWWNELYPPKGL